MKKLLIFTIGMLSIILLINYVHEAQAEIVCDRFDIIWHLEGNSLEFSLDTDLPDSTGISIRVSRSYWEKEDGDAEYGVDYFDKSSTVGECRTSRKISLDNKKWETALRDKQKEMAKFGLGFDVAKISDKIRIYVVVPLVQSDPRFGKRNKNLVGNAVIKENGNLVKDEVKIEYPLKARIKGRSPYPNKVAHDALEKGKTYKLSKKTGLASHYDPADPLKAINKIESIPPDTIFRVNRIAYKGGTPWYQVTIIKPKRLKGKKGWINSLALLGQEIYPE